MNPKADIVTRGTMLHLSLEPFIMLNDLLNSKLYLRKNREVKARSMFISLFDLETPSSWGE